MAATGICKNIKVVSTIFHITLDMIHQSLGDGAFFKPSGITRYCINVSGVEYKNNECTFSRTSSNSPRNRKGSVVVTSNSIKYGELKNLL